MSTHSKDLLYGTQPAVTPSNDDDTDDTQAGEGEESSSDLGQGSGEEHISFSKETPKKRAGGLLGDDEEPTAAFDELGNPIPQADEEDDGGGVPII